MKITAARTATVCVSLDKPARIATRLVSDRD
jgi:hypothetical protein